MAKKAEKVTEKEGYENVRAKIKSTKTEAFILNAVIVILGIIMIAMSSQFNQYISQIIGAGLCLWGILRAITFLRLKSEDMVGSYALVQGAAMIGFGLLFLMKPDEAKLLLNHLLGMAVMVTAVMKLQDSINFIKLKIGKWALHLVCAAILVALGVIATIRPQFSEDAAQNDNIIIILVGVAFVISGFWDLFTTAVVAKNVERTAKAISQNDPKKPASKADNQSKDKDKPAEVTKIKKTKKSKNTETKVFEDPELDAIDSIDFED